MAGNAREREGELTALGFFLTLIYILIIYVRPQEFIEGLRGMPILQWVAGACVAGVFLEGSLTLEKFRRTPLNWLVLAFWFALVMSQLGNFWFSGAMRAFSDFSTVAVLYFLIVMTADTWRRVKITAWLLVFMASLLAGQSIVQYYTGVGLLGGEALERSLGGGETVLQARGIGIFADPNDLALNLLAMLPFTLPAFHKGFMSRTWLTSLPFIITQVTGLLYTRSRGGILGLAMVGWYYLKQRVGKIASVAGFIIIMSILLALPRMETISTSEASARGRMDHWAYGLSLLKSRPLFGVGYLQFTRDYHNTAHNSFVLVIAELGLFGGFLWVALFYVAFRDIRLMREEVRGPPFMEQAAETMMAALLGWHVSAFFLSQSYKPTSFILLGLVAAMQNALASEGISLDNRFTGRDTFRVGVITVAAVVLMHLLVRLLWSLV